MRSAAGVIGGYLTLFVFVMATFAVAFVAIGTEGVFEAGSYEPTVLWLVVSFVLGLLGAMLGGLVCAAIAQGQKPVMVLAGVVLVLGLLMAIPALTAPEGEPAVRGPEAEGFAAMQSARQPLWVTLVNPFLGAIGVLLGGRLRRSG